MSIAVTAAEGVVTAVVVLVEEALSALEQATALLEAFKPPPRPA